MAADPGVVRRFISRSPEATELLGRALGLRLTTAGAVVALIGELGAGKTTLVRGLARGLGVDEPITSPTFTLMQEASGRLPFFHFDAWMAEREARFLSGGGAELLGGEGVAAVEWAERVEDWLPRPRIEVDLAHAGPPQERRLVVRVRPADPAAGPRERELERVLETAVGSLEAGGGLAEAPPEPVGGCRADGE